MESSFIGSKKGTGKYFSLGGGVEEYLNKRNELYKKLFGVMYLIEVAD